MNLEKEELKYTYEKHNSHKLPNLPWIYCKHCGLVFLNNAISKWCIRMGCNVEYHPDYNKMLNKLTS